MSEGVDGHREISFVTNELVNEVILSFKWLKYQNEDLLIKVGKLHLKTIFIYLSVHLYIALTNHRKE